MLYSRVFMIDACSVRVSVLTRVRLTPAAPLLNLFYSRKYKQMLKTLCSEPRNYLCFVTVVFLYGKFNHLGHSGCCLYSLL